jgi:hypothetical protein
MKNVLKAFGFIALVAIIGFSMMACGDGGGGDDGDETVLLKMTFEESYDWNKPGNEDWSRWTYDYKDASKPFDLSSMYAQNKVYRFTYSFESDIGIDVFSAQFNEHDDDFVNWIATSEYTMIKTDVKKNTKYSGSVLFIPIADAAGTQSAKTYLQFHAKNRNVSTTATLSFYQFSFEIVDKDSGSTGNEGEFNNLDGLKNWLNKQQNNSKSNPFKLKLKLPNLSGLADFLKGSSGKFVNLDLSGSNFTSIGDNAFKGLTNLTGLTLPSGITGGIGANAFDGCTSLTDITLPSGVTGIGAGAFAGCTSLTSVTFSGAIASGSLGEGAFPGDLIEKYLAGGAGTYTRTSGGTTWTKEGGGGGGGISTPTGLTATTASATSISLSWNAVSGASGYYVYCSESQNGTYEKITIGSVTTTSTTVNGLYGSNKTWWFKISAYDSNGNESAQSSAVSATTSDGGGGGGNGWVAIPPAAFVDVYQGTTYNVDINAITYGNNKFVAVGQNAGDIAYSSDGINWTKVADSKFDASYKICDVVWGSNKFVAVGGVGQIGYSSDGITWTLCASSSYLAGLSDPFGNGDIYSIAWGNNKFVAVGMSGKMVYSSDGVTWTAVTDSKFTNTYSDDILAITYGNNKFIAGGRGGKMAYSEDGINWTAVADSKITEISGIAWGNDKFVAVGNFGKMAYSPDGIAWTAVADSQFNTGISQYSIRAITYGNNKFVAVGVRGKAAYSSDGINWTVKSADSIFGSQISNDTNINDIVWGNGKFVAVGASAKMAYWNGN